jgi:formylglycine-generating enzyme required for sulfatase activity
MKPVNLILISIFLCFLAVANTVSVEAQTNVLDLSLYPGISITGPVSSVYAVEATTNAAQTNGWTCLAFVQLPATNYLWVDTNGVVGQRFYRTVAMSPASLVFIPPGLFRMGSPTNEVGRSTNESPQTQVTLTRGFFMGTYPVTQGQFLAIMGSNPTQFPGNTNRAEDEVTWTQATNYCALLTQQQTAAGLIPPGSQYRLPTEAEWEYACRALTSTEFYYGDDSTYTNLANYAWYSANSGNSTQPIGLKLPNPWGLYDMAGNVFEWCADWIGTYPGGSVTDPQGAPTGTERILRGGSWFNSGQFCRSAERESGNPIGSNSNIGFRVVLAVP